MNRRVFRLIALFVVMAASMSVPSQGASGPKLELKITSVLPKNWGTTFAGTIHSAILGEDRNVSLFVPNTFNSTTRTYPVVYFTDGESDFEPAVVAVRELFLAGHIPDCVVVAVETPNRTQDMTPPGMGAFLAEGEEKGEKFLQFIARELKPQLESTARIGRPAVLVGHSHGGILAHYAAADWRDEFPFIVSLDAPMRLQDAWLVKNLEKSLAKGGYLRLVSLEVRFGWPDEEWNRFAAEAPKDWMLVRQRLPGEMHESMVFAGFYEGLKAVFSDYSKVVVKELSGPLAFANYEAIAKDYGGKCIPPESVLRRAVMELTVRGDKAPALRALGALAEGYGEPSDRAQMERDIDEAAEQMKGKESIEQLQAVKPTAEQIQPYVGTWRGTSGTVGGESMDTLLVITVKDGQGAGTFTSLVDGAAVDVQPLTYLRVTAQGMEFGFLNGMFPPGILSHEAVLKDGTLEGQTVFKGIYFKYPPDMKPPKHVFSLKKIAP